MPHPRAEVVVDLEAYRHNLRFLKATVEPARLMAVLKGDAYGHGMGPLAEVSAEVGIDAMGALDIETGLALRRAGVADDIMVFAWLFAASDDLAGAVNARIDLGVSSMAELSAVAEAGAGAAIPARVHLKIDTGLHRNGASEQDWPDLVRAALAYQQAGTVVLHGAWTHIAEASHEEDSASIARFEAAIATAEGLGATLAVRHLAASAAGFSRADSRFDLVRMGAFTLGISPGGGITAAELGLAPVMTLRSRVLGEARAGGERCVIVPIGTGDGLLAEIAGRVAVAIGGHAFPVRSVELDHLVVGIGAAAVSEGDPVVLFGPGHDGEQTLQQWADALGTIGEEIVVRLSPRLPRRYLRG